MENRGKPSSEQLKPWKKQLQADLIFFTKRSDILGGSNTFICSYLDLWYIFSHVGDLAACLLNLPRLRKSVIPSIALSSCGMFMETIYIEYNKLRLRWVTEYNIQYFRLCSDQHISSTYWLKFQNWIHYSTGKWTSQFHSIYK